MEASQAAAGAAQQASVLSSNGAAAANAGSVTLTADGGGWTQTCFWFRAVDWAAFVSFPVRVKIACRIVNLHRFIALSSLSLVGLN